MDILDSYGHKRARELREELSESGGILRMLDSSDIGLPWDGDELTEYMRGSEIFRRQFRPAQQGWVVGFVATGMIIAVLQDREERGDHE